MSDDPRTEPLKEWNRLARENTENAIVSSMFEAAAKSSDPMEQFSSWLLMGTAAIASFLIANSDKLLPLVSREGFLVCGGFLSLSCAFGFLSKIYALRCKIGIEVGSAVRKIFGEHLAKYEEEELKIQDGAKFWGINLETGIRMERVLSEFYKSQPKIVVWFATRLLRKFEGNPQIGHLPLMTMLNKQGLFSFVQAVLFFGFLISGFIYAAKI
ncbi:MAG: hypothetical protein OEY59_10630 [Deltaproteobacteria bacterium]|nr:hypothetical protein [Deltaproteobacteria bacterium]